MTCPKCGDKKAECIIGDFWKCPTCDTPKNISEPKTAGMNMLVYGAGVRFKIKVKEYSDKRIERKAVVINYSIAPSVSHEDYVIQAVKDYSVFLKDGAGMVVRAAVVISSSGEYHFAAFNSPKGIVEVDIDHKRKVIELIQA